MVRLEYDLEPDEHSVKDGYKLAQHLIGTAYRAVVPYVAGCRSASVGFV